LAFAVVALVAVAGAGAARAPHLRPVPGQTAALAAVKKGVAAGRLTSAAARADRGAIAQAVHLVRVLPQSRGRHIEVALEQIGALGAGLTAPRAVALFGQLQANDAYFARHGVPAGGLDITDTDGIVYRYFAGRCFEFHPLAEFGALNARVAAKDVAGTERLANALMARAVSRPGGGLVWEYYFPFGGGAPWTSGMAQSVAAQAFARAASLVPDDAPALTQEATAAFKVVPKLTTRVAAGPWIRLYSFSSLAVLNAQLQSVLSLQTYATATNDAAATTLASQFEQAAAASVSRFDTGYWTYYSLGGAPTPLSYQKFIVQLLQKLAPQDPRFAQAAADFAAYLKQPPAFKLANTSPGAVRFWLSKPSLVTVTTPSGLGRSLRLNLLAGWHTLRWSEPKRAGFYAVHVSATDFAGNRASFSALPVVRASASASGGSSPGAGGAPPSSQFAVGVGIDDSGQGAQAASLGLSLVRRTVTWQSGQTAPDPATVQSLQGLPSGTGLVLDLDAEALPTGDAGRAALAEYAASLAQQSPALRDLLLTPAPDRSDTGNYADALAAIRTGVRSVTTEVGVGPFLDGSTLNPQLTTAAVARELAQDNAAPDLVDFLPAPVPAAGAWAVGDLASLESTVAQGLGTKAPPVLLDAVPSSTTEVTPTAQASGYASAIETASCLPGVSGVFLDRLVDGTTSAPATGLYDAGGQPKPSAVAVKEAVAAVARGAVVCPGLAAPVTPTTLTFPTELTSATAASVTLGCSRDCLYLVTLDRAGGRPVVARRGALAGGAAAQIALPKHRLPGGGYRLDVRLVSRVDPGAVKRVRSGLLNVG
jgi:D-glucuronyl C5-epimerase C-terminus